MTRLLVAGLVIAPEFDEDIGPALGYTTSLLDDAAWAVELRRPFTWQRFLNWWAARRYLVPRDIRKQ